MPSKMKPRQFKMQLYFILFVMFLKTVTPYSSGAPSAACGDMIPGHGPSAQDSPPPYTISVGNSTLSSSDKVLIEIEGQGVQFKGFFIQAHDSKNTPIGSFHSTTYKVYACGNGNNNAITHSGSSLKDKVTLQWQPPQNYGGDVNFKATVVQSFTTFWTNLLSSKLSVVNLGGGSDNSGSSSGPAIAASPTDPGVSLSSPPSSPQAKQSGPTDETPPGGIQKLVTDAYNDCGSTKSCFGSPAQCVDNKNCQILASFTKVDNKYEFELLAKRTNGGQYVAIGFGDDAIMGDDAVIVCSSENEKMDIFNTWNDGNDNLKVPEPYAGLQPITTGFSDDTMYCSFKKDARSVVSGRVFNFDEKTFYILVSAGSFSGGVLRYHGRNSRLASGQPVRLGLTSKLTSKDDSQLKLVHGCLMVTAWIGAASCGILFARYYKKTWVKSKCCSIDIWFHFHRFFMVSTWSLTIAAFIIIVYSLRQFRVSTHSIVGVISVALCFIQPFMAALRPHPGTPRRSIFNWLHWLVGNSAQILGISAIFLGFEIFLGSERNWVKEVGWYTLIAFIIFHISIHLILSFSQCATDNKVRQKENEITFPMKDLTDSRMALQPEDSPDAPLSCLRKLIITIYIPITWFAVAILIVLLVAKREDMEATLTSWGVPSFWQDVASE